MQPVMLCWNPVQSFTSVIGYVFLQIDYADSPMTEVSVEVLQGGVKLVSVSELPVTVYRGQLTHWVDLQQGKYGVLIGSK